MALLEVTNLGISFGGLRAVDSLNLTIEKGQLYGLIGPNGAGKTTAFNLLTGVYKPTEGIIKLDGKNITGKSTIEINKAGIARTFQNIRLFKELSVLDNVKVGLHNQYHYSTLAGILRLPSFHKVEKQMDEKAIELTHKIAKLLQDNNMYAELSGSGVRSRKYFEYDNKLYAPYPFKEFYKILSQYNIEFVLGCDAHSPEQLDDDAVRFIENLAQELNLKVINTFYKLDL